MYNSVMSSEGDNMKWLAQAAKYIAEGAPKEDIYITTDLSCTCQCGKTKKLEDLEDLNTGVFICKNDICKGCKEGKEIDKKLARVVCAKCKRVTIRIKPAEDKTGFRFIAGKTYHQNGCAFCDKTSGEHRYTIIEKAMWNRTHGVKRQTS